MYMQEFSDDDVCARNVHVWKFPCRPVMCGDEHVKN
jgi:hypothetical protein